MRLSFWGQMALSFALLAGFFLLLALIGAAFVFTGWVTGRRKFYCPVCGFEADRTDMAIHRVLEHGK